MLAEAENERMHLMTFIQIAQPSRLERILVIFAQFVFIFFYSILYILFPRTAHRLTGYFEEEAVISYTEYLNELEAGTIPDQPAPEIAINYWNLPLHSTLKDVVRVIRDDEAGHRDVNHQFADLINIKKVSAEENKSQIDSVFELKLTDEQKILDVLIKEQNLETVDLTKIELNNDVKTVLPSNYIKTNFVAPFKVEGNPEDIAREQAEKLEIEYDKEKLIVLVNNNGRAD